MFEIFQQYLISKANFTAEEFEIIETVSKPEKLHKNECLLQAGDVCYYNCFIVKGCMRLYRTTADGREHTIRFANENWWITDWKSWNTGKPAKYSIDCLEDCDVLLFTKADWEDLKDRIPAFYAFEDILLEKSYYAKEARIDAVIHDTAKTQYLKLLQSFPTIFDRATTDKIASYLGVTIETLDSIRNHFTDSKP